jgi:hypothetical protein
LHKWPWLDDWISTSQERLCSMGFFIWTGGTWFFVTSQISLFFIHCYLTPQLISRAHLSVHRDLGGSLSFSESTVPSLVKMRKTIKNIIHEISPYEVYTISKKGATLEHSHIRLLISCCHLVHFFAYPCIKEAPENKMTRMDELHIGWIFHTLRQLFSPPRPLNFYC